ncbi:hypothetical protein L873DRAFT_1810295 [Choiromyces venosus 120613-1]|uniref:Uncharacterized protein n=1 Tax=Choiromyces venosus 120613-1 TaxID=1336337 RepID=A0A3N4JJA2_9PEZI|nr:hypothetical protein L873DRAFT_1810295 [Choiromyces venosus 120613-1]
MAKIDRESKDNQYQREMSRISTETASENRKRVEKREKLTYIQPISISKLPHDLCPMSNLSQYVIHTGIL